MELVQSGNYGTKQTPHTLLLIHGLRGMGLIGSSGLGLLKGDSVG